jgi:hypothetical protein
LEEIVRKTTCFSEKNAPAARQNGRDVYININDVIIIGKTARKMNAFRRRPPISPLRRRERFSASVDASRKCATSQSPLFT